MSIRIICLCGRGMILPDKYAGQHVQCPNCRAMLRIPSSQEDPALTRWFCKCGLRLKARARTAGRKLRCPRCAAQVAVPFSPARGAGAEEDFLLDEPTGSVIKTPEGPLSVKPQSPEAQLPSAKDDDNSGYLMDSPPDRKSPAAAPPASATKTGAKKSKSRRPGTAADEDSWAENGGK